MASPTDSKSLYGKDIAVNVVNHIIDDLVSGLVHRLGRVALTALADKIPIGEHQDLLYIVPNQNILIRLVLRKFAEYAGKVIVQVVLIPRQTGFPFKQLQNLPVTLPIALLYGKAQIEKSEGVLSPSLPSVQSSQGVDKNVSPRHMKGESVLVKLPLSGDNIADLVAVLAVLFADIAVLAVEIAV